MKKLNLLGLAVVLSFAMCFVSCGGNAEKKGAAAENETVYDVDSLTANVANLVGDTITVKDVCSHICQHGGRKIFLVGADGTNSIRCEASKEIGAFKPESKNSVVTVKGIVNELRKDEAYVAKMEEAYKAQTAEKHGEGGAGCESSMKASKEKQANTFEERMANLRADIAKSEKGYIPEYFIVALEYNIEK